MVLIIGGMGAGKRSFARSLGYTDQEMTRETGSDLPVVEGLEEVVARSPQTAGDLLEELCRKELVLCCEVGSGIVPVSASERMAREETGRLTAALAARAQSVVRIVAGIPIVLKGELPCGRC